MNRIRLLGVSLAGILLGLAGTLIAAPDMFGPALPILQEVLSTEVATSRLAIFAVGSIVALGGVLASKAGQADTDARRANLEALLGGLESSVTGERLTHRLRRLANLDMAEREEERDQIQSELRETTRKILLYIESWPESEIDRKLANGSWTDNPGAAALFSESPAPLMLRLREWLGARSSFERRIEQVIQTLEDRVALDTNISDRTSIDREQSRNIRFDADHHRVIKPKYLNRYDQTDINPDQKTESTWIQFDPAGNSTVTARNFGLGVGFLAVSLGLLTGTSIPFLIGLFGVGFAISKRLSGAPAPKLKLSRTVGSDNPLPGDLVDIKLEVENASKRSIADLRVIDGPPEPLEVVEGSLSLFTSLQPGASDSVDYTIRAKRGTFSFNDISLITRSVTGTRERSMEVAISTRLSCKTLLDDLPLIEQKTNRIGTVKTDRGGSGIEFYGTREYRHGDPLTRVNWNQLAKTRELTTVEYREQRAPTVAIVLDQREAARLAPNSSELDAVDLSVYAAEQAFLTLLEQGMEVGLVTYGDRITEIEPADGPTQRALVQSWLRAATDRYAAALGESDVSSDSAVLQRTNSSVDMLENHVPRDAQVLLLSPAIDEFAVNTAERFSSLGQEVTLLSPDITSEGDIGRRRARLDRLCGLKQIRDRGVRVVDWHPDEALEIALNRGIDHYG